MNLDLLLDELFPSGHEIIIEREVVFGTGRTRDAEVAVIGTRDHAYVGVEHALALSKHVLQVVREHPRRPILLLVDTRGQRLSRRDELLGINAYLAHLTKTLDLARRQGHQLIGLVYGEAVSGGFLSFGMMADHVYALPDAKVRVMNLPSMARVTKIPLERLKELADVSLVFSPGVENYVAMGAVNAIWEHDLAEQLELALTLASATDLRRSLGAARGGRGAAESVARRVREGNA